MSTPGAVRAARGAGAALSALVMHVASGSAHPLHTSLVQLSYDAARKELSVSLRVFADDFDEAVARAARLTVVAGQAPPEAAMYRYVTARLALTRARGEAVPLVWCGARRTGEMLFVCLRAPVTGVPNGLRLRNAILVEAFGDQVNIVQYTFRGPRHTTLFIRGDGAKPVP